MIADRCPNAERPSALPKSSHFHSDARLIGVSRCRPPAEYPPTVAAADDSAFQCADISANHTRMMLIADANVEFAIAKERRCAQASRRDIATETRRYC